MKKTLLGLLLVVILGGGCGDEVQNEDMAALEKDNPSEGVGLFDVDDERIGALITIDGDGHYAILSKQGYLFRVSKGGYLTNRNVGLTGYYYFDNICEDGPYIGVSSGFTMLSQQLMKIEYVREVGTYPYTDYADIHESKQIALLGEEISVEEEVFEKQTGGNPDENIETVDCEEVEETKIPNKLYEINHISEEDSGVKLFYSTPLTIKKDKK